MSDTDFLQETSSRRVHDRLSHPVIDADGHWLESHPIYLDFLRDVAGPKLSGEFEKRAETSNWYRIDEDERQSRRVRRPGWWTNSADALDRATLAIPSLMYERLDSFGVDFSIVYPTRRLTVGIAERNTELRIAMCRAYNTMAAEMFAEFSDRMTPVAVIPMSTPEEAIAEAKYAVEVLHLKAAMILGAFERPVPAYADLEHPPTFIDTLVLDSVHDYDPLWQAFSDLKVAVTVHSGSNGWPDRRSPSNFCFNHVGHFAEANQTFARALFFSGVTYRFPKLNFCLLEGGVGWACNLLNELVAHWRYRSPEAMSKIAPSNLDTDLLKRLYEVHGGKWFSERAEEQLGHLDVHFPGMDIHSGTSKEKGQDGQEFTDEFGAAHITSTADVRARFSDSCFFGCEADDPMTSLAFNPRFNLKAVLGTDIGHPDVPDMTAVLEEAYELVDDGELSEADFQAFTFGNVAKLHGQMNPEFFAGTSVEKSVKEFLA